MNYRLSFMITTFLLSAASAMANEVDCAREFSRVINARDEKSLEERLKAIVLNEMKDDMGAVNRTQPERIRLWNRLLEERLRALPRTGEMRGRRSGLKTFEINQLYYRLANHPVADYSIVKKYDPKGKIGFCFGRAAAGHLLALPTGIAKENIKKVWAIGTMYYKDEPPWAHHVATMVRHENGNWYVIDPEYGRPLTMKAWMKEVKKMDRDNKVQFFATDASRFGVVNDDVYNISREADSSVNLYNSFYNKFFEDLLRQMREDSAELRRQRLQSRQGE